MEPFDGCIRGVVLPGAARSCYRCSIGGNLAILLGLVLAIWSLLPIYNMWMIALDSHDDIFAAPSGRTSPTLESFHVVVTEDFWYLR